MPTVADCLRQHGGTFLQQDSDKVSLQQRRVLSAISRCRTGELGHVIFQCGGCGRQHWVGRSCSNRHCPGCQHEKTQEWLRKQTDRLLPVQHFLVTFTVPDELRLLLRARPKDGYDAIFAAGSATIQSLLGSPKWLGSPNVGFFGVLHTWGRDPMIFHPHVHFIVPGGGVGNGVGTQLPKRPEGCSAQLSPDPVSKERWLATPGTFLFPEAVASPIYRQKFREALRETGLENSVDPAVWHHWWEVNVKPVSDGRAVLKYLAPYVFRVAISDNRILECTDESVTFRYTPSKSKTAKTRTVPGVSFVRGFLQHVLPKGFQKVRYYGWMASNSQTTRDRVKWLVWLFLGWTYWLASGVAPRSELSPAKRPVCEHCGGDLKLVAITDHHGRVVVGQLLADHATSYLDSG